MKLGVVCECGIWKEEAVKTMTAFGWSRTSKGWVCPFHANGLMAIFPPSSTECTKCRAQAAVYRSSLRQAEHRLREHFAHNDFAAMQPSIMGKIRYDMLNMEPLSVDSVPDDAEDTPERWQKLRAEVQNVRLGSGHFAACHDGRRLQVRVASINHMHSQNLVAFLIP